MLPGKTRAFSLVIDTTPVTSKFPAMVPPLKGNLLAISVVLVVIAAVLVVILLLMVVIKFASSPIAAANSFKVSNAPGAESIRLATSVVIDIAKAASAAVARVVYAVIAVVLADILVVFAVTLSIKFLSSPIAAANSSSVSSKAGALAVRVDKAEVLVAIFAALAASAAVARVVSAVIAAALAASAAVALVASAVIAAALAASAAVARVVSAVIAVALLEELANTVAEKLGSSPNAAASSFKVSNAPGAESIILAISVEIEVARAASAAKALALSSAS